MDKTCIDRFGTCEEDQVCYCHRDDLEIIEDRKEEVLEDNK